MRLLIGLVAFLVWSGGSAYWYVCKVKGLCPGEDLPQTELVAGNTVEKEETISTESLPEKDGSMEEKDVSEGTIDEETIQDNSLPENAMASEVDPDTKPSTVTDKYTILFAYAKPLIANEDEANQYMQDLASYVMSHPGSKVKVTGFTDDTAAKERNKVLGMKRAKVIAGLLESQGVPKEEIELESLGEADPVATNETPAGRKLNRRVEITVLSN